MEREQRLKQFLWNSSIRTLKSSQKTFFFFKELSQVHMLHSKSSGTLCSHPQAVQLAEHTPNEANKSSL